MRLTIDDSGDAADIDASAQFQKRLTLKPPSSDAVVRVHLQRFVIIRRASQNAMHLVLITKHRSEAPSRAEGGGSTAPDQQGDHTRDAGPARSQVALLHLRRIFASSPKRARQQAQGADGSLFDQLKSTRSPGRCAFPSLQNSLLALTSHLSVTGVSGWPLGFCGTYS
jgi:hypothetical protein